MTSEMSLFESGIVSIFSIGIVFLTLVVIAFIINRIKIISTEKKETTEIDVSKPRANESINSNIQAIDDSMVNDEELVAVIAAAIASSLGIDTQDINIQKIRRIPQNSIPWRVIGIQERLFGKL